MAEVVSPKRRQSQDSGNDLDMALNSSAAHYPRKRVAVACEVCRLRKTKCDANRPCSFCAEAGIECVYRSQVVENRQSSAVEILSRIEERLARVEAALHQAPSDSTHSPAFFSGSYLSAPSPGSSSREITSSEYWRKYFQAKISIPYYEASIRQTASEAVVARPSLVSFQRPYYLNFDSWDDTAAFYDDELDSEERFLAAVEDANARRSELDLSNRTLWELQKNFVVNLLKWLPLMDLDSFVQLVDQARALKFSANSEPNCLAMFGFAIGAISATESSQNVPIHVGEDTYPGLAYFAAGRQVFDMLSKRSRRSIVYLQCRILQICYLTYAIRPIMAWDVATELARDCMHILTSNALHNMNDKDRYGFHRVFWICSVLLHELEAVLKTHPIGLRQFHDMVPLPIGDSDTEVYYYFFAQASLRKLLTETLDVVGYRVGQVIYAPVVAAELCKQLEEWYQHLPPNVQFPLDPTPVFDIRKAFLRVQYVGLRSIVLWPSVLQLLEREATDDMERQNHSYERLQALKTEASSCISICALCCEIVEGLLMFPHIGTQFVLWAAYANMSMLLITYKKFPSMPLTNDGRPIRKAFNALKNFSHLKVVGRALERAAQQMTRLGIPVESVIAEPSIRLRADGSR